MSLDLLGDDAIQLGHSANMIAALPDTADEHLAKHVRHACRDAFGVHAALIAGFLVDQGDNDPELAQLIDNVEQHVTTYGDARGTQQLATIDTDTVRAMLLPKLRAATQANEWLTAVIDAAIDGDYPT
jgi:hypothetical protein